MILKWVDPQLLMNESDLTMCFVTKILWVSFSTSYFLFLFLLNSLFNFSCYLVKSFAMALLIYFYPIYSFHFLFASIFLCKWSTQVIHTRILKSCIPSLFKALYFLRAIKLRIFSILGYPIKYSLLFLVASFSLMRWTLFSTNNAIIIFFYLSFSLTLPIVY